MPFTPAHAAAALPFRRTRLLPSALIIGTMAPDFEYFLRMSTHSGFGHTFLGVFTLTLPLALAVLWLYHAYVKAFVVALVPRAWQIRLTRSLEPFSFLGPTRFLWILLSILIGITTHVVWDSFTHPTAWPVQHWAFLRQSIPVTSFLQVPLHRLLQHISTLLGLAALATWLWRWYHDTPASGTYMAHHALRRFSAGRKLFTVAQIVVIASAGAMVRVLTNLDAPGASPHPPEYFAALAVCTLIALLWWQLVAYGLISRNRQRFGPTKPL